MPQYWLLKTEPGSYSYDDLEREGRTRWDGITSNAALKNLRAMQAGDLAMIYHSGKERLAVGLAEVVRGPYPDPAHDDPKRVVVDIRARKRLAKAVALAEIKADPAFADFGLVRITRLSVVPASPKHWHKLMKMAGEQ